MTEGTGGDRSATSRECGEEPRQGEVEETVNRESHPNAGGPAALAGDMGVSSERQGPFEGIEGTGSLASVQHNTDGESPPAPVPDHVDKADESHPAGRPKGEPTAEEHGESSAASGVDRRVGEVRPDPVANKHEFAPSKTPRH